MNWLHDIEVMRAAGVTFESGMSEAELTLTEQRFRFRFPPDLREFLSEALPVASPWATFPDWRSGRPLTLLRRIYSPIITTLKQVRRQQFWWPDWGLRPQNVGDAVRLARQQLLIAPRLIPLFNHYFIPDKPNAAGNPVFFAHFTDVDYVGRDLHSYILNKFVERHASNSKPNSNDSSYIYGAIRRIPFWSEAVHSRDQFERAENGKWVYVETKKNCDPDSARSEYHD